MFFRCFNIFLIIILGHLITGCGGSSTTESINSPATISAGENCDLIYAVNNNSFIIGSDPLFENQWSLKNLGQSGGIVNEDIRITNAWKYSLGQGVIVAVIDDAVELTHPDIKENVVPGSISFRSGNVSGLPIPCNFSKDHHGTAVAGIILARDNNYIGISGVAPRASLIAYDTLSSMTEQNLYETLTKDNQRISIYHNSWGSPDTGAVTDAGTLFPLAIQQGIEQGRNGYGSIFVFSSGNGGPNDNSNLDGFLNKRGIITVCAVNDRGQRTASSEQGTNILVCAHSEGKNKNIVTTALNGGYRQDFSGSSAAAPQVTGVIALMLSARPKYLDPLSWRDIQLILAQTARKNDPLDPQWRIASGGSGWVHPYYGYGIIDAEAAVQQVLTWNSVGKSNQQRKCDSGLKIINQDISDVSWEPLTVTTSLYCPEITKIEFVEIEVSTTHSYHGDLRIEIQSAEGKKGKLVDMRTCNGSISDPCGAFKKWKFGSVHHMGEFAQGSWSLIITDLRSYNIGKLESWRLTVYGQ